MVDAVTLEDGRAGVQSRWLDFEGRVLMTEPAQALDRSQLVGVQARGRRGSALLLGGQGSWELRCDELDTQAVPSDGPPSLLTRPDGAVGLRGERGGLIQTRWFLPESG